MNAQHLIRPLAFRRSRGGTEPVLTLSHVFGNQGQKIWSGIESKQKLCFHSVGCTGATSGPRTMALVAGRLADEKNGKAANDLPVKPTFLFHLEDIIYSFGEEAYYYDQFYFPYRNYLGPIIAIPGNHDGLVKPGDPESTTLASFFKHFCADEFTSQLPAALDVVRTPQVQPEAYFINGKEIPYLVAGNGGHLITRLPHHEDMDTSIQKRLDLQDDDVVLEQFDDRNYGFLRINVNRNNLKIRYVEASSGAERDIVTVDLNSRNIV
jgi:hypothetical protein